MALVSAATFKSNVATAAADLTVAWSDSVLTEVAADIRHPSHPLRKIQKLFSFNAATGVISSDDVYIDAAYAGSMPSKGSEFDVLSNIALTLTTATVEDASPTLIVLTFSNIMKGYENLSLGGSTSKTVSGVVFAGNVVTITANAAYVNGDTITVTGNFFGNALNAIQLTAEAVTNNVV